MCRACVSPLDSPTEYFVSRHSKVGFFYLFPYERGCRRRFKLGPPPGAPPVWYEPQHSPGGVRVGSTLSVALFLRSSLRLSISRPSMCNELVRGKHASAQQLRSAQRSCNGRLGPDSTERADLIRRKRDCLPESCSANRPPRTWADIGRRSRRRQGPDSHLPGQAGSHGTRCLFHRLPYLPFIVFDRVFLFFPSSAE